MPAAEQTRYEGQAIRKVSKVVSVIQGGRYRESLRMSGIVEDSRGLLLTVLAGRPYLIIQGWFSHVFLGGESWNQKQA
jgi:hypothetical protein